MVRARRSCLPCEVGPEARARGKVQELTRPAKAALANGSGRSDAITRRQCEEHSRVPLGDGGIELVSPKDPYTYKGGSYTYKDRPYTCKDP